MVCIGKILRSVAVATAFGMTMVNAAPIPQRRDLSELDIRAPLDTPLIVSTMVTIQRVCSNSPVIKVITKTVIGYLRPGQHCHVHGHCSAGHHSCKTKCPPSGPGSKNSTALPDSTGESKNGTALPDPTQGSKNSTTLPIPDGSKNSTTTPLPDGPDNGKTNPPKGEGNGTLPTPTSPSPSDPSSTTSSTGSTPEATESAPAENQPGSS